ncbi:hypothetical protein [Olivibacter oleidegradans]|uniref:Uncharacterized protein n=1 Tax=Olivibacter oleidegradans TaxID=760123 RepID=A0ABV6HQ52_9SPHI
METRDLIEKMIESLSKALKRLLKIDANLENDVFINEFEKFFHNEFGTTNDLEESMNKIETNVAHRGLLTTDMILILYRAAKAYQKRGNNHKSKYYHQLGTYLESKPRTISLHDHAMLVEIDEIKKALYNQ